MKKIAFVFPGQGSQYVGMSKSFYDDCPAAKEAFNEADTALGSGLTKLVFEGPEPLLGLTENTQPALLVASIAALRALEERCKDNGVELTPAFLAGHSLGEYTSLVAAGSLALNDAVRLVSLRGKFMQEGVPKGTGKMSAIIGLDIETVERICRSATINAAEVVPANINSPAQVVISGHTAAVEIAERYASEEGAKRVIPLQVSVPSHSPLMSGAAERLAGELDKVFFAQLATPVISNVEAEPVEGAERVRELLTAQLTSPVRWVDTIRKMKSLGVETIIEVGPGKVLSGLTRRIDKTISTANLDNSGDLDGIMDILKDA